MAGGESKLDQPLVIQEEDRGVLEVGRNWWCLFVTVPLFMGYGAFNKLQSQLRSFLFIGTSRSSSPAKDGLVASDSTSAYLFGFCVSCFYLGLLMFRVGHNVILGWKLRFRPRHRVLMAVLLMALSLSLLSLLFYIIFPLTGVSGDAQETADHHSAMILVLILYFFAGAATSIFEPNIMSILTPLGKANKSLAAIGIAFGTNSITIIVLFLLTDSTPHSTKGHIEATAFFVAAALCIATFFVVLLRAIPDTPFAASEDDAESFIANCRRWRDWIGPMTYPLTISFIDHICLAMSVAIGQYMYGDKNGIPLLSPFLNRDAPHQYVMPQNNFLMVYFFFGFLGAVIARHFTFFLNRRNPTWFLLLTLVGCGVVLSKIPLIAPIGFFLVMYGNGAIYSSCVRYADELLDHKFNLVAMSLWMAMGDLGGFIGANAVVPIHTCLGSV